MKSFWFDVALRLAHTVLGLIVDRRAGRLPPAKSDSTAGAELPATAAPGAQA